MKSNRRIARGAPLTLPKRSTSADIALAWVNAERGATKLRCLSADDAKRLRRELSAARRWHAEMLEQGSVTIGDAAQAVASFKKLTEQLAPLLAPRSALESLSSASPEQPSTLFGWLLDRTKRPHDTLDALRAPLDLAGTRRAQQILIDFQRSLDRRLKEWQAIAKSARGTGTLHSKALGSTKVLALWGLIKTWLSYTTARDPGADLPPGTVEFDEETDGARFVDIGKRFEAFAKAAIPEIDGHDLRSSIKCARERAVADGYCWPRASWNRLDE